MVAPPLPSREDEEKLYAALGRAVTDWAHLDQELYKVVLAILGCTDERAAVVFYRTPTLQARLTLASDLIATAFPRTEPGRQPHVALPTWNELKRDIERALNVRNRLAHYPVAPIFDVFASEAGETKIEVRQASYISMSEHQRNRGSLDPLGVKEIEQHIRTVSALVNRLRDFRFQRLLVQLQERA